MVERSSGEAFISVADDAILLDALDKVLDDKDSFLIKLPHKFKESLGDPTQGGYALGSESVSVGKIEPAKRPKKKPDARNPELGLDSMLEGGNSNNIKDKRLELLMPLLLPSKHNRQSKEQILFELGLPSLNDI